MSKNSYRKEFQHPFIIRATHWINAVALGIMIASGLRIYNASPIFDFTFPHEVLLGGWLAGARQWHFFGMWLFAINGIIYIIYNVFSKHGRLTTLFRSSDVSGVFPMILYYMRIRKQHPPQKKYNALQKLAYTIVPLLAFGGIISGIAIYWPVQFSGVTAFFGGYDRSRFIHFVFMASLVGFIAGHLLMVVIAGWSNFISIITGWKKTPVSSEPPSS